MGGAEEEGEGVRAFKERRGRVFEGKGRDGAGCSRGGVFEGILDGGGGSGEERGRGG